MFGPRDYARVYLESAILTASPGQLILLLFDGAGRSMAAAHAAQAAQAGSSAGAFLETEETEQRGIFNWLKERGRNALDNLKSTLFGGPKNEKNEDKKTPPGKIPPSVVRAAKKKAVMDMFRAFPAIDKFEPHQVPPPAQRTQSSWRTKRERNEDIQVYKPTQTRFSNMYDGPLRAQMRAQQRFENNQIYATVYQVVEDICTKRMPKPFFPYCGDMLRKFQVVADGLRWRDRPDAICMSLNFCGANSYIQQGAHATYKDYY